MLLMSDGGAAIMNLMVMAVFGGICAAVAAGRGRSPIAWFFIGAILNCIGLILVLVLPDLKMQEEREKRMHQETRKLREQLMKERQIADQRHQHVERRIGAHDEALGLDTSPPPQLPGGATSAQLTNGEQWFYARDNERQGPVSSETIRHLLAARAIHRDTLVWVEGMSEWSALHTVAQFQGDLS